MGFPPKMSVHVVSGFVCFIFEVNFLSASEIFLRRSYELLLINVFNLIGIRLSNQNQELNII